MRYRLPATPLPATLAPQQPPRQETYETASAPWDSPPPPLAVRARTLRRDRGPCPICRCALLAGDRVADLDGTGQTVHVTCAASTPGREQ